MTSLLNKKLPKEDSLKKMGGKIVFATIFFSIATMLLIVTLMLAMHMLYLYLLTFGLSVYISLCLCMLTALLLSILCFTIGYVSIKNLKSAVKNQLPDTSDSKFTRVTHQFMMGFNEGK